MAKGRGRSVKKVAAIDPKIDPKRRARWQKLRALIEQKRREEALGWDAYWEAIGEVLAHDLWAAGDYESAEAFRKDVVREPKRTMMRNVRVARYASPEQEVHLGTAVIDAAIGYVEAKLGGPIEGKLPFDLDTLRVAVEVDGKNVRLGLDEVTVEQLRAATTALTRRAGTTRSKLSPSEKALRARFAKVKALAGVKLTVRDGMLDLRGVPLHAVADLVRALRSLSLPVDAG